MSRQLDTVPKDDALHQAIAQAADGQLGPLSQLLSRHGGLPGLAPNVRFAQTFARQALALADAPCRKLLSQLADTDGVAEDARAFLPVAAAHGLMALIEADRMTGFAWSSLASLAADERTPVRVGTLAALKDYAARPEHADRLLAQAQLWLEEPERETCFGAAALATEIFADATVLRTLTAPDSLLAYLSEQLERIAAAPRAAERSPARRRALTSLSQALPVVVATLRAGDRGTRWFSEMSDKTEHPDLRKVLSDTLVKLGSGRYALPKAALGPLRETLQNSAKPLRNPTLVRPGTGRGKRTRKTR